jgi:hypothetical protein
VAVQTTSYTLTQLIDRVKGDLGLRGSNFLTDSEIELWAEEGSRLAAQQTHWYRKTSSVNATSGTADYDLPTDCIALLYIAHNDLPLVRITRQELEDTEPYWRDTGNGTPLVYYLQGTTSYTLYPTPGTTIASGISRHFIALPSMPSAGANTFDFPQANEMFLLDFCLFRASLKATPGEGEGKVAIYERRYMAELQRLKQAVDDMSGAHLVMGGRATRWRRGPFDISHRIVPAP